MSKDIQNVYKKEGKSIYYSDVSSTIDVSQTISDFLKDVQNISVQTTTTASELTFDIITCGIMNVLEKFTIDNNFIIVQNDDFIEESTIPSTPDFILLSTTNNYGMYLRVPYIYIRGEDIGEVLDHDYVPIGGEAAETWLTIIDSKFKVTGPFTQIKSDKTAFRDKIITVGYIDRVELVNGLYVLSGNDDNDINSNTSRGVDFEYTDFDTDPTIVKLGFMGYSFERNRFIFYKDATYQFSGDLTNENKISKNNPNILNEFDLDHIYTNKIHASEDTTIDYIEIISNDYLKLYSNGTFLFPSTPISNSVYINALKNCDIYVENGRILINTGNTIPNTINDGEIYLNAEEGIINKSKNASVILNSQDESEIELIGNTSIISKLINLGTTYEFSILPTQFKFGTITTDWISIENTQLYSNNSSYTLGKSSNYIGTIYTNDIYVNNIKSNINVNNNQLQNVDIVSGSINNTTIGTTTRSTGKFTTLDVNGITTITNTTDSTSITTGALIISGGVGIAKNVNIGNKLNVDGITTLNNTLDVDGETTLNDTLDVDGATTLNDTLDVDGKTTLNDTLDVDGATTLNDTLDVDGATTLNDTLDVDEATTLDQVTIDTTDGEFSVIGTNKISLNTEYNNISAISLITDGGTKETINIINTQGNTKEAILITSKEGGIIIDTKTDIEINSSNGDINIGNDNINKDIYIATAGMRNVQIGTTSTTIDINSLITTITSEKNLSESIYIHSNGGTAETIKIHAEQGINETSINVVSDNGGITLNAESGVKKIQLIGLTTYYANILTTMGDLTLTNLDTGSIVLIDGNHNVTLPTIENGLNFRIITLFSGSSINIIGDNNITFIGTTLFTSSYNVIHENSSTGSTNIELTSDTDTGTTFECYCNGIIWFIRGIAINKISSISVFIVT